MWNGKEGLKEISVGQFGVGISISVFKCLPCSLLPILSVRL